MKSTQKGCWCKDNDVMLPILAPVKTIIETPKRGRIVEAYFDEAIEDAFQYRDLIQKMRAMTEDDELHLLIHCPGGDVNTAVQLYNEIISCKAKTVAHLYHAYSAGGVITLACDEVIVKEFATFMCHNVAYGVQGKGAEARNMVEFINKTSEKLMHHIYDGFLTKDELKKMLKDEDFWFDEDEIKARLAGWTPIRRKRKEKAEKAQKVTKKQA